MALKNTAAGYGAMAKSLHWIMALLVISLVALGLYMGDLPRGEEKSALIRLHGSSGLLAITLLAFRLGWKVSNPAPAPLSSIKWQTLLASLVHWGFYGVIAFMVVSGSLSLLTVGWDLPFFGLFSIPTPYERDMDLHHFWEELHEAGWNVLAVLFVAHIGAVLFHQIIGKKQTLKRML